MMAMSQTVKDVINENHRKLEDLTIDTPLGPRASQLFDKATTRLDPQIYKGDSKAYRSDSQAYETGNETLNRMSRKSESVKDWIGGNRYGTDKNLPDRRGNNLDTAPYSGSFEDVATQYLMGEGRDLYSFLRGKGRDFYDITRLGTDLEGVLDKNAIAAVAIKGTEAALVASKDFGAKVSQLASQYGLSTERALKYVLSHELVVASQKGKYFDDPGLAKRDVDLTLKEYFASTGEHDLAGVASDRAAGNYNGSYSMPKGLAGEYSGKGYAGSVGGKASASGSVGSAGYAGSAASAGTASGSSASAAGSAAAGK